MDESQQDTLRTIRTFVGAMAGGLAAYGADQSYAAYDAYSGNSPYRYQTLALLYTMYIMYSHECR